MIHPPSLISPNTLLALPQDWDISGIQVHNSALLIQATLHNPIPVGRCDCEEPRWVRAGRSVAYVRIHPIGVCSALVAVEYQEWRCANCRRKGFGKKELGLHALLPSFERQLGNYLLTHSVLETKRQFAVSYSVLRSIFIRRLDEEMAQRIVPPPRYLAVDDTMMAGARRLVLMDLERGTYIDILPGYGGAELRRYLEAHGQQWRETLVAAAIDPYAPFRSTLNNYLPDLPIAVDRFHVVSLVQRSAQTWMETYMEQHGLKLAERVLWVAKTERSPRVVEQLARHPQLAETVQYVRLLRQVYEQPDRAHALLAWHQWVHALPDYLRSSLGRTLDVLDRNWRLEICTAVDHRIGDGKPLGTGKLEAKHKLVRYWSVVAPGSKFETMRKRLLVLPSRWAEERAADARLGDLEELQEMDHARRVA